MRRLIKKACYVLALAIVCPVAERFARRLLGRDVWFTTQAEALSLLSGTTGYFLRNTYYRLMLKECALGCCLQFSTLFTHSEAEVRQRVYTGARCIIGMATIGDDTMLADNVQILGGSNQHGIADPTRSSQDQLQSFTRVRIGSNCWIGGGAIVMADIGDHCAVAAGSVVTKPAWCRRFL